VGENHLDEMLEMAEVARNLNSESTYQRFTAALKVFVE